jgi:hypothetical protein
MTSNNDLDTKYFEVSLGHATVFVYGKSIPEAIAEARKLLCKELPRMWDVIHSLDAQRFQVRLPPST